MYANIQRSPPTILTYCYNSELVYVAPAETYDQAVDFAQGAFSELRDTDRSLIHFQVRVVLTTQSERKSARIDRTVWPHVVASLAQYEIVEILVASPQSAAPSAPTPTFAQPPPYAHTSKADSDIPGLPTRKISFGPDPNQQSHIHTLTARFFRGRSSRDSVVLSR